MEPLPIKIPEPLVSKTLDLKIYAKNVSPYDVLTHALKVVKAYGVNAYVEFPKGYTVRVWPDSYISDLLRIEELEARIYNDQETKEFISKMQKDE